MDHMSDVTTTLLEKMKKSTDYSEIIKVLLDLLDSFKKEKEPDLLKNTIAAVLGAAIKFVPFEHIDEVIIRPFMPIVKLHLFEILSSVHYTLKQDMHQDLLVLELTKSLEVCVGIISEVENLLSYLISLNQIPISAVFHLPKPVIEIINQVFIHCQRSKADYKEVFPELRNNLMNLFQNCYKLQLSIFTLLNEKLLFDCNMADEVQLLVDVLNIMGSMGEVVAELDTMSLVAHWKGYTQLSQNYASHLRQLLDVARPINYLSVNISHQLCSLIDMTNEDNKLVMKMLKISSLQVKVLIKLCEHYKDYLGDCHKDLTRCLITLAAFTDVCLKNHKLSNEIINQVTAHVAAGAAPLLTHLIADQGFVQEYFRLGDDLNSSPSIYQIGYSLLTGLIMKKIIQLPAKDQNIERLWLKVDTLPLVNTVFRIMELFSENGELVLVDKGDIYQALVEHTAAFIIVTCTEDMFPNLETTLMRHLLQPCLWPALCSSDLLCLIGRLGTDELCFQLTNLLREVLSDWLPGDRQRPEWFYISWTLSRLNSLLSPEHLRVVQGKHRSPLIQPFDLRSVLDNQSTNNSISLFHTELEDFILYESSHLFHSADQKVADILYELWPCMTVPVEVTATETAHWFLSFYSVVISATSIALQLFTNSQIIHMLDVVLKICSSKTSLFHCGACLLLRSIATLTLHSDASQSLLCKRVSALFVCLMSDANPISKQFAFETFSYFAHVTKYEQIVSLTVANSSKLQAEISSYFENIPAGSSKISVTECLQYFQKRFIHKCRPTFPDELLMIDEFEEEQNPVKKFKGSEPEVDQISSTIETIEKNMSLIEEQKFIKTLSPSHVTRLTNILKRLDNILDMSYI